VALVQRQRWFKGSAGSRAAMVQGQRWFKETIIWMFVGNDKYSETSGYERLGLRTLLQVTNEFEAHK
jgi:hypothetical protein